jgi:hypothetical protein
MDNTLPLEKKIISRNFFADDACAVRSIMSVLASFADNANQEILISPRDLVDTLRFRRANSGHMKGSYKRDQEMDHEKVVRLFKQFKGGIKDYDFLSEVKTDIYYFSPRFQKIDLPTLKKVLSLSDTEICVTVTDHKELRDHIMHIKLDKNDRVRIVSDESSADPYIFEDQVLVEGNFDMIVFTKHDKDFIRGIVQNRS